MLWGSKINVVCCLFLALLHLFPNIIGSQITIQAVNLTMNNGSERPAISSSILESVAFSRSSIFYIFIIGTGSRASAGVKSKMRE